MPFPRFIRLGLVLLQATQRRSKRPPSPHQMWRGRSKPMPWKCFEFCGHIHSPAPGLVLTPAASCEGDPPPSTGSLLSPTAGCPGFGVRVTHAWSARTHSSREAPWGSDLQTRPGEAGKQRASKAEGRSLVVRKSQTKWSAGLQHAASEPFLPAAAVAFVLSRPKKCLEQAKSC